MSLQSFCEYPLSIKRVESNGFSWLHNYGIRKIAKSRIYNSSHSCKMTRVLCGTVELGVCIKWIPIIIIIYNAVVRSPNKNYIYTFNYSLRLKYECVVSLIMQQSTFGDNYKSHLCVNWQISLFYWHERNLTRVSTIVNRTLFTTHCPLQFIVSLSLEFL